MAVQAPTEHLVTILHHLMKLALGRASGNLVLQLNFQHAWITGAGSLACPSTASQQTVPSVALLARERLHIRHQAGRGRRIRIFDDYDLKIPG